MVVVVVVLERNVVQRDLGISDIFGIKMLFCVIFKKIQSFFYNVFISIVSLTFCDLLCMCAHVNPFCL